MSRNSIHERYIIDIKIFFYLTLPPFFVIFQGSACCVLIKRRGSGKFQGALLRYGKVMPISPELRGGG